jgi:hypothetical protein
MDSHECDGGRTQALMVPIEEGGGEGGCLRFLIYLFCGPHCACVHRNKVVKLMYKHFFRPLPTFCGVEKEKYTAFLKNIKATVYAAEFPKPLEFFLSQF